MSDFRVEPDQILAVSAAFAQEQEVPARLASVLDGARGADAGDPGLNSQIQVLVGEILTALTSLEAGLTKDATGLRTIASNYEGSDVNVSSALDSIRQRL